MNDQTSLCLGQYSDQISNVRLPNKNSTFALSAGLIIISAASVVKNGEGGYLDPVSTKVTNVGGVQVVMFNAGHTTDGVTVFHKTAGGQWLDVGFSTTTGGDGSYNAQDSPHYKTFLSWLEEFVKLNP